MLPAALATMVGLAALCVVVAGARQVADLLAPVALAVTLVITVFPLHGFLRRRGLPSWISTAAMMMVLLLVLTVVIGSVGLAVGRFSHTSRILRQVHRALHAGTRSA